MDFVEFECARALPSPEQVEAAERKLGFRLGPELRTYVSSYGYLAAGDVELRGLTGNQGEGSDFVACTLAARDAFEWARGRVVIYKPSDDVYVLCDEADFVHVGDATTGRVEATGAKFFEYVVGLFARLL